MWNPGEAKLRRSDTWMMPDGVLTAVISATNVSTVSLELKGRQMTLVSFTAVRVYRVNGTINEQHQVGTGPSQGAEPCPERHALTASLHRSRQPYRCDVSDRAALSPKRSQKERWTQRDGHPHYDRSGECGPRPSTCFQDSVRNAPAPDRLPP